MVLEGMRRKVVAENCGMDRQRLCDWVRRYNAEGVEGLCNRRGGGTKLRLTSDQTRSWRLGSHPVTMANVGSLQPSFGGCRRPEHPKADPQAQADFKENFADLVAEALPDRAKGKPLEVWFQDEARVGQLGKARNPPARPSRYALRMELYLRGGLSGTRNSRRADLAIRQY